MAKPDPVTLGKAAVYAFKFEKGLHETSAMLKKAAIEMIDQLNAEVPVFVDKILTLAVAEEVPEIMNILKASEEEQRAYLDAAKRSAGLTKSTSNPLKKISFPSSEEIVKIMHRTEAGPPFYRHQFNPQEPKKDLELSGIPHDDIMRAIKLEAIESIRKGRERLRKQAEDEEPLDQPLREEQFMEECIDTIMLRDPSISRGEAEQQCHAYLNEKLHPEVEEERKSRMEASNIPSAEKTFKELTKKQQP